MHPLLRLLPLFVLAHRAPALLPHAHAAPASAAPAAPNEVVTASGLRLSADLREEYVAGFSLLVAVTVRNDTDKTLSFPDLSVRPHLVRFKLRHDTTRWERYTTPPEQEPSTLWTLAPRGQRRVLLEIPSSAGLDPGDWELGLDVLDPAGTVSLPARAVRLAPAKVVGGGYAYEATIQQSVGAMFPWVHQAARGFDLYLMRQDRRAPARTIAQLHLAHLDARADPILTRARAGDALARHLYWQIDGNTLALARLESDALAAPPRSVSLPYPKMEPLGRGVSDAKGGVIIPLWVPAPKGAAGVVQALCIDVRGAQVLREVVRLPTKPTVLATAVDAASNLLLAIGHATAVDLYRVDPSQPAPLGTHGARITPLAAGWGASALGFDTLPDQGDRAGGLALLSVLRHTGTPQGLYRGIWADLSGNVIVETNPLPWTAPGELIALLPAAYQPFHYLSQDAAGKVWYGVQGSSARAIDGGVPGVLWPSADAVNARKMVDGRVIEDRALGPLGPVAP